MIDVKQPLVSICIPTYNAEKTLPEMLNSIISQTYRNLDIQIVDNASTDRTLEIAASFSDERISIHEHEKNVGAEGNFNRCIALAEGKYTAIFHADDVYEPHILEKQVAFLEQHQAVGGVFTEAFIIDENATIQGRLVMPPRQSGGVFSIYTFPQLFKDVLKYSNFLICPSAMLRTDLYKSKIQVWNGAAFKSSADLDVWLRAAEAGPIAILHEKLIRYRISSIQFSSTLRARVERSDFLLVIDHYLSLPWVQQLLSNDDLRYARALERTDYIVRAVNLYLIDRVSEARSLSSKVLSWEAIIITFTGRRGSLTFLVALALQILIRLRLSAIGKPFLKWAKHRMRK